MPLTPDTCQVPESRPRWGLRQRAQVAAAALPGFKEVQPQVFAGLFPVEANQYDALRDSLEKLTRVVALCDELGVQTRP